MLIFSPSSSSSIEKLLELFSGDKEETKMSDHVTAILHVLSYPRIHQDFNNHYKSGYHKLVKND
jgi:hypothetical protein